MRERLITLFGALLALAVVYGLFFGDREKPPPTKPVTAETGPNGLYAVFEWLNSEGVPTLSLRDRYSQLSGHSELRAATGNIMVAAMPFYTPVRDIELAELKAWIDQGNTLLVLASLNDTSDWSYDARTDFINDLYAVTDLWFSAEVVSEDQDGDEETYDPEFFSLFEDDAGPQRYDIVPIGNHPLMDGVNVMTGVSDGMTSIWTHNAGVESDLLLKLGTMAQTETPMVWQRKYGSGQIIIVGSGTVFSNRVVGETDNRTFFANVVTRHLGAEGRVIFDDMHQGLSSLYDPEAFYSDSRLVTTIWFVVLFWLLYIVGSSNRLLSPRADAEPLQQSDFLHAVGSFISNHASKTEAGLWLYRSWFNDVRRHLHLPANGQPVWDELSTVRTLDPALLGKLRRQYSRLSDGRRLDLVDVHNTIYLARKAIG